MCHRDVGGCAGPCRTGKSVRGHRSTMAIREGRDMELLRRRNRRDPLHGGKSGRYGPGSRALSAANLRQKEFEDDGGFAVFVVGGGGADAAEAVFLVDGEHGGVAFAAVGDDAAETVALGIFDLPILDAMAQTLSAVERQE